MPTPKRRLDPGVASRLLAAPHRFQFFQAVRVLEQMFVRQGENAEDVVEKHLRFRNTLSLAFPPSEIERLDAYAADGEKLDDDQVHASADDRDAVEYDLHKVDQVHLTPSFFGMLGVGGVLPLQYSERLARREVFNRDRAARAFLDIFNTRATALFYAAWRKYRPALHYELDRRERFLPLLLSLSGVGMPSLRDSMHDGGKAAVFDQSVAFYSGEVLQRPVSAAVLQRLLGDYFRVPLRVEQFAGAWYAVPPEQQTRLGSPTARLGAGALAGSRVWQRDLRVRLWIGPLNHARFTEFLPGGSSAEALRKWVTLLTGVCLEYQVCLILRPEDVRGAALGGDGGSGGRLGWDAFVATRPCDTPRADATYEIHTLPTAA